MPQNNSTLTTPLTDPQGFPRADIDVYTVRHTRAALARTRNDHRAIVEELGKVLELVYARGDEHPGQADDVAMESKEVERADQRADGIEQPERIKPFAKVNTVAADSPAAQAVSQTLAYLLPNQFLLTKHIFFLLPSVDFPSLYCHAYHSGLETQRSNPNLWFSQFRFFDNE